MTEWKMRSGLLFAAGLLLSAGALGQTVTFTQTDTGNHSVTVASEYFGAEGGREVLFVSNSQAAVRVDIADDATVSGTGMLEPNNEKEIVFTLTGATFAASATTNNLLYYEDTTAQPSGNISRELVTGGARGDSSVTYKLTVNAAITPAGGDDFLYFTLPALMVDPVRLNPATDGSGNRLPPVMGAAVVASFNPGGRAAANPFPDRIVGAGAEDAVQMHLEGKVVETESALTASLGTQAMYAADVATDNRKVIVANSGVEVPMADGTAVRGLQLGMLSVTLANNSGREAEDLIRVLRTQDTAGGGTPAVSGSGQNALLDSSLNGTAAISVAGSFQEDDRVLLLPAASPAGGTAKAFEMNAAGAMTVEVPLGAIGPRMVVYVPGGVDDLTPGRRGTFRASLSLDFNDDRNKEGPVMPNGTASGVIQLEGVMTRAYAHGVRRANDLEVTSFLRLTCASAAPPATGCNVFLSCYGEDGADYFGDLTGAEAIPSDGTGVYSSGQIASALSGGWSEGGGRCDLLSNGVLEVQHMVRTSSLHLHNNSVVIGRTQRNSIAILRSGGGAIEEIPDVAPSDPCLRPDPVDGCIRVDINPALDATRATRLLTDGRIYGPINIVRMFAGMEPLQSSEIIALGTEFAFLERSGAVAPTSQVALSAPILASSVILLRGDIIYPSRALFRPGQGIIATSTGLVLSR